MGNIILGIDISKKKFEVALVKGNKTRTKKFDNDPKGFYELKQWLENNSVAVAYVCMEATGGYEEALAHYLYDNKFHVSVINPARIKGFSMSHLSRVKTDKADCKLIAHFCQAMKPDLWHPLPTHIRELQQLTQRLDVLIANKNQETNRLKKLSGIVADTIQDHILFLDQQIKKIEQLIDNHINNHSDLSEKASLLESIPGIGKKTVSIILAFLSDIKTFRSAKQLVVFVGLKPKHRQSGSSLNKASKISKTGDAQLRKTFYWPAIIAMRFNPIIKDFSERLGKKGKFKIIIVIAAMRKLLHIIFGVLKSKTIFNLAIEC